MQNPIIVNAEGWKFKKELTQIEYYGIYAFVAESYTYSLESDQGGVCLGYDTDAVERMFGFAPSGGNISCTNHVEWPGFEHLGPVDYFSLTENHILCAVYVPDDDENIYLRIN